MDIYCDGSDFFCGQCGDESWDCYDSDYEACDYPVHCANCHMPLNNQLTTDGVQCVLEAIKEELQESRETRNSKATHWELNDYYYRCNRCAVVYDWAKQLKWYSLSDHDERIVDWFLRTSKPCGWD